MDSKLLSISKPAQELLRLLQDFAREIPTPGGELLLSNRQLTRALGFDSNHTLIAARKELIDAGYILFSPGQKNSSSIYQLSSQWRPY